VAYSVDMDWISVSGIPHRPKPPTVKVRLDPVGEPVLAMASARAACADGDTFETDVEKDRVNEEREKRESWLRS